MSNKIARERNFIRRLRRRFLACSNKEIGWDGMRVYHFTRADHALSNLSKKRLKIATIADLNDPFEWNWLTSKRPGIRRAIARMKISMSADYGLLCFSADWQNPVQWSHYADRHRGICLGFEVPKPYLAKVEYFPERQVLNKTTPDDIRSLMIRAKFQHWHYEKEWRAFEPLKNKTVENGLYFTEFGKILRLKRVIIGPDCDVSEGAIRAAIGDTANQVEVFKARRAFRSFKIVRQRSRDLWPKEEAGSCSPLMPP